MLIAERQSLLQELLAQRGMSDLDSLASELQVSQSTVRRDLEYLEKQGLLTRTHGGALLSSGVENVAYEARRLLAEYEKQRIGERAHRTKTSSAIRVRKLYSR